MSQAVNGGGGIPREGRERAYATELWLDGPSAFWLHPEGPLSEMTPDEWRAKQPKPVPVLRAVGYESATTGLAALAQNAYSDALLRAQFANYRNALATQHGTYGSLLNAAGFLLR